MKTKDGKLINMVVWAVSHSDYDEYSIHSLHEYPKDAYKAAGYFDKDGKPKIGKNATYYDVEPMLLLGPGQREEDDSIILEDIRFVNYWEIYLLPAAIRKYEEGKKLDRPEKVRLGLAEPRKNGSEW